MQDGGGPPPASSIRLQADENSVPRLGQPAWEEELLNLPPAARVRLAKRLISSLDEDGEIDREWTREAQRRDEEVRSGEVETLPLEDALEAVRERFGW